tara:strand:+ start:394 stop:771 length:378 start_codon:yes stop_codon:yes gene_type:complete
MIYDLDSGAPEFDGAHYEPSDDPYFYRQADPTCWTAFSEKSDKPDKKGKKKGGVMLFSELKDAYIGVVEHPRNPPVACYSIAGTKIILKEKHGLNDKEIKMALDQLKSCDLGPNTPCFLDSTDLE